MCCIGLGFAWDMSWCFLVFELLFVGGIFVRAAAVHVLPLLFFTCWTATWTASPRPLHAWTAPEQQHGLHLSTSTAASMSIGLNCILNCVSITLQTYVFIED